MLKVLNIKPELLTEVGDCQSSSLMKLFEYYNKDGFESILDKNYDIEFFENGKLIGFDEVETYNKFNCFEYKDVPGILERTFSLKNYCIYNIDESKIIFEIDREVPVLMEMTGTLCPWIDIERDGCHFFLIVGHFD